MQNQKNLAKSAPQHPKNAPCKWVKKGTQKKEPIKEPMVVRKILTKQVQKFAPAPKKNIFEIDVNMLNMKRVEGCPKISSLANADKIFELLQVSRDQDDNLRVLDSKDTLALIHYVELSPQVMRFRGTIVDVEKVEIVSQCFPFTKEYRPDDSRLEGIDLVGSTQALAYEGTILRVYYHQDAWKISTYRKIDVSKSRWAGGYFEETFFALWGEKSFDSLDKSLCYVFLLSDPENRIACQTSKRELYQVGTFSPSSGLKNLLYLDGKINPDFTTKNENVKLPETLSMPTIGELTTHMLENDIEFTRKASGILVTLSSGEIFKVVPVSYVHLRGLRGDDPSKENRFTYLWVQDTRKFFAPEKFGYLAKVPLHKQFLSSFPELQEYADFIQEQLPILLADDFESYYVKKDNIELETSVLEILHRTCNFFDRRHTLEQNIRHQMSRVSFDVLKEAIKCIQNRLIVREKEAKTQEITADDSTVDGTAEDLTEEIQGMTSEEFEEGIDAEIVEDD